MWADNETSEDLLGFKVHADLLIEVINDESVLPTTIGVFGDWGSGKSSILQIIKAKYEEKVEGSETEFKDKDTLCIYFNGWTFEGYDDAKAALLNAILKELEDNKKLSAEVKDAVKEKAKKLWKSIDWMRGAGMVMKNIAMPAVAAYFTGGVSLLPFFTQKISELGIDSRKDLIGKLNSNEGEEFYKSLKKEEEIKVEKTNAVADFRQDFEELLNATKFKKLVVIIDDLDRCTPDRIIENLEAVKLFLNVSKTAFIIGADPRIVRHAIELKYSKINLKEGQEDRIIDDYLEKIIQIPYFLPKLSEPEVETYISLLLCKRELDAEKFKGIHSTFQEYRLKDRHSTFGLSNFETILSNEDFGKVKSNLITIPSLVPLITNSLYGNPRQIKRFLNTYTLRQRLANIASIANFKDAVLAKLMILEYSELKLFIRLFAWQSNQNGTPEQIVAMETSCLDKSFEDAEDDLKTLSFHEWSKPKIIKWLQVEPKLSSIDLRDYFWISRDKIDSSITASSIVPQIVKKLFNELQIDGMTSSVTKEIFKNQFTVFNQIEKESFMTFLSINLKKNPKIKRNYEIFNCMLDENIENTAFYYQEALKQIRHSDIEPAVGLSLKAYKNHSEIGEFLKGYFKANKTSAEKAFNLNS